jgi:two-component system chemotaxis response regulator CheY
MFPPNTKILVVDDMLTMRKIVTKQCKDMGFTEFVEAADGQIAWTKLNETPDVGLIISDWNMPNCTGLELLKRVRVDSRFKKLPFILVTAESETEQVKEAVMAGVDNYVVKPFTPDAFSKKITETYNKFAARNK